jgi:hypothetical protein
MSGQSQLAVPTMQLLSCDIDLRRVLGEELCTNAELSTLLLLHNHACRLGNHDEIVVSLVTALTARNRQDEAIDIVAKYIRNFRREKSPLRSNLAHLENLL